MDGRAVNNAAQPGLCGGKVNGGLAIGRALDDAGPSGDIGIVAEIQQERIAGPVERRDEHTLRAQLADAGFAYVAGSSRHKNRISLTHAAPLVRKVSNKRASDFFA